MKNITQNIHRFGGTFVSTLLIQFCTVMQGILLARWLGPEGRGMFATATIWPIFFAGIGGSGMSIALGRLAATDTKKNYFKIAFATAMVTASLTVAVYLAMLPLLLKNSSHAVLDLAYTATLFIPINHLSVNIAALDQGAEKWGRYNLTRALLNPLYFFFICAGYFFDLFTCRTLVFFWLTATVLIVLLRVAWMLRDKEPCIGIRQNMKMLKGILKEGSRFTLAGAFQSIYAQLDQSLVLWLLPVAQLGLYTTALSASTIFNSITSATGLVLFSICAHEKMGEGFDFLAKIFRLTASSWLVLGLFGTFALPILFPVVYGKAFSGGIHCAQILIWGVAFNGLLMILDQAIRGQGKAFTGLISRASALILICFGGYLLTQHFGITGMAAAYVAGQFFALLVMLFQVTKHYRNAQYIHYVPRLKETWDVTQKLFSTVFRFQK